VKRQLIEDKSKASTRLCNVAGFRILALVDAMQPQWCGRRKCLVPFWNNYSWRQMRLRNTVHSPYIVSDRNSTVKVAWPQEKK
jgi:hypothetical protein